ncbi:hypothetical protein BWQ96_09304 [Gracilariopsis chorda]|uniref:Uncharacterized protein n=1 Tax=Gracilariopsis chorda TaxID=448386 RepID=A0A2V3IG05_9FLOR|nr:hypothetical protein BWQ96_09304 [Gracilariopsis chorda]|eukprot:PXF40973.1 hypothetical protein BWQ96_09304 [Gracilariopsis chorda]
MLTVSARNAGQTCGQIRTIVASFAECFYVQVIKWLQGVARTGTGMGMNTSHAVPWAREAIRQNSYPREEAGEGLSSTNHVIEMGELSVVSLLSAENIEWLCNA